MILIFSNKGDISTSFVIRWLNHLGCEWKRINDTSSFFNLLAQENSSVLEIDNLKLVKIDSIWYRRNIFRDERFRLDQLLNDLNKKDKKKIVNHIIDEQKVLLSFLTEKNLKKKKSINSPNNVNISKLKQLEVAKEVGLNIPDSYIISAKSQLEQLLKKHTKVASKPMSEMLFLDGHPQDYGTYTELITINEYASFPDSFYPIFVQSYIDKLIEIRSFYLMGNFYSMAMFTQKDNQTTIDFRRYNFEKPTRSVPFNLPLNIEKKLTRLMRQLNLNCGSFDILVDKNYNFYFLEVNPVGQFGMVSIPCNYYLEKQIAETLKS